MTETPPPFVRTPEANFEGLDDFDFEPRYFEIAGMRMHYVDTGPPGSPVALMIHGMPTWSYLYRHIIPVMRDAGYRCIAPDHIGFGRSDKVTNPNWYDIARHTHNLSALITSLDLANVTLFVQDWGGPIGLAQVAGMKQRFSRLVIMNTWLHHEGYEYSPGIKHWISQNEPGGLFREHVPSDFNWGTLMVIATGRATREQALEPIFSGETPTLSPVAEAVRRAYDAPFAGLGDEGVTGPRQFPLSVPVRDSARGNGEAQARHFEAINATDLPVHFIWGLADHIFTGEWGESWRSRIPHATWDALDDAAHFLQDTHGQQIAEIVLDYSRST